MQVIYLNVNANKAPEKLNIKDDLQNYYNLIECNSIDIVRRKIGKRRFNIVCDDEGMLTEEPKISAISNLGEVRLVGLSDEEAEYIIQRIEYLYTRQYPQGYYILTQCEY